MDLPGEAQWLAGSSSAWRLGIEKGCVRARGLEDLSEEEPAGSVSSLDSSLPLPGSAALTESSQISAHDSAALASGMAASCCKPFFTCSTLPVYKNFSSISSKSVFL